MKQKDRSRSLRRCAHCGRPFAVDPRLGKRHRFCSRPACAQASRRTAQQKWLKRSTGKDHFCGWENVARVREWRKRHPQYWQRTRRHQGRRSGKFRLTRKLAAVLRCGALQDTIDRRLALEIGMISRLSGAALQDAIAREIRATARICDPPRTANPTSTMSRSGSPAGPRVTSEAGPLLRCSEIVRRERHAIIKRCDPEYLNGSATNSDATKPNEEEIIQQTRRD